jgi:hypothetical protein
MDRISDGPQNVSKSALLHPPRQGPDGPLLLPPPSRHRCGPSGLSCPTCRTHRLRKSAKRYGAEKNQPLFEIHRLASRESEECRPSVRATMSPKGRHRRPGQTGGVKGPDGPTGTSDSTRCVESKGTAGPSSRWVTAPRGRIRWRVFAGLSGPKQCLAYRSQRLITAASVAKRKTPISRHFQAGIAQRHARPVLYDC